MPRRIDINEGEGLDFQGPVAVAMARGKVLVLVVGGYDADNLLESVDDCKRYACRLRDKIEADRRHPDQGEIPHASDDCEAG